MKLSDLQNKHKNEIIFIVGAGTSINNIDIDLLRNYTVMAVNSGILAAPFAKYLNSDDPGIIHWDYFDQIKNLNCICLFFEDRWRKIDIKFISEERKSFYIHKSWFSPPSTYNLPGGLILTKDINSPIIGAKSSMGSSVHLAYCLGAKTIVLLGNDCQLSKDGKNFRYFWQYWKKENQPQRRTGTTFNKRTQNIGFDQKAFIEYWNYFAKVNKNILGKEVKIIDCSDSSLNCFPKMNLKEILDKYGSKRK